MHTDFFIENLLKKATFRSKIGQDRTDNMLEESGSGFYPMLLHIKKIDLQKYFLISKHIRF